LNKKTLNLVSLAVMMFTFVLAYVAVGNMRHLSALTSVHPLVLVILMIIALDMLSIAAMKRALVKAMEDAPTLRVVALTDFPQLDKNAFDYYDAELTGLGFERRFCYTSASNISGSLQGIACVYYHPLHKCNAENAQIFKGNSRIAWGVISSRLDDNWSLSNSNMIPNPIQCVLRKPRALWKSIPKGGPRELLDAHLQMRQSMMDDLGIGNITTDSEQAYFDAQTENHHKNREALRKKNAILLRLESILYKRMPILTWMGDLQKATKNRPGFSEIGFRT
jgi:hypothetical protein